MTYVEFMTAIEEFYGPYDTEFKREYVFKYLMDKCKKENLDYLFSKLTETFPSKYKTAPTNAEIKTILEKQFGVEEQSQLAWDIANDSIITCGMYRGVFFEDTRIQATIESMGGWPKFCCRNPEEETWDKKDFFKYFARYALEWKLPKPKKLNGINTDDKFEIIGDKVVCLEMLEETKLLEVKK